MRQVRERMDVSCKKGSRDPSDVVLIAVSKTKPVEMLMEAYQAGARDFGENKVQELVEKSDVLPKDIRWHMIGHLQRNNLIGRVWMIHSVDSLRLAEEISREAVKKQTTVNILIEVNVAREESKFGVMAEDAENLIREISVLPGVYVKGLMTIAPYVEDAEKNRKYFACLKQLAVDIERKNIDNVSMNFLSMGMTADYWVAVEEGASFVRVGTGIFGERDYGA